MPPISGQRNTPAIAATKKKTSFNQKLEKRRPAENPIPKDKDMPRKIRIQISTILP
jgi:hypothetical protein